MKKQTKWLVFDGEVIPASKPIAPVSSRGLMYGDGVFETFRVYGSKAFLLDKHLQRLQTALQVLDITPPDDLTLQKIKILTLQLLKKNALQSASCIARLQVWREGNRGYNVRGGTSSHFSLSLSACPETFHPPALVTTEVKRIPSEALPSGYKFTNGVNYILAAREAEKQDADDALMETVDGYISETTIANIFWIKNNTIFTPSRSCDILPGITRQAVIDMMGKHNSLEIKEGKYRLKELLSADGVWMTNSVREVLPVRSVNDIQFNTDHSFIKMLQKDFTNFRDNALSNLSG